MNEDFWAGFIIGVVSLITLVGVVASCIVLGQCNYHADERPYNPNKPKPRVANFGTEKPLPPKGRKKYDNLSL